MGMFSRRRSSDAIRLYVVRAAEPVARASDLEANDDRQLYRARQRGAAVRLATSASRAARTCGVAEDGLPGAVVAQREGPAPRIARARTSGSKAVTGSSPFRRPVA